MGEAGGFPKQLRGRYEPIEVLGRGAFGAVHRARDRDLGREVAVKVLHHPEDAEAERRFAQEAAVLATLRHPGLAEVFDHGLTEEGPYLVMEVLEGETFERRPPEDPLSAMLAVAETLDAVHEAGIVHRDLKPANLLATRDGRVLLIDFGLVHDPRRTALTRTGMVVGTLAYLAPEQLRGAPPGPATDWFAWGATLYELVEGRLPFPPEVFMEIAGGSGALPEPRFRRTEPEGGLAELLRRCLSPDPARRPGSAAEVRTALEGGGRREEAPGHESLRASPLRIPERARGRRIEAGVACALALGLGAWALLSPASPVPAAPAPAASPRQEERREARARLERALERLMEPHRRDDGALRTGAREGWIDDHVVEVKVDLEDPRVVNRWSRTLDALEEWASVASPGEAEAPLLDRAFEAFHHWMVDEDVLFTHLRNPNVFGNPHPFPEASPDPARLEARMDELRLLREAFLPRWRRFEETRAGLRVGLVLRATAPFEERLAALDRAEARFVEEEDPVRRARLALAVSAVSPGLLTGKEYPCEAQEVLQKIGALALAEDRSELPPRLRVRLAAANAFRTFFLMQTCRTEAYPEDLVALDRALDRIEEDLDAAPGASCFYLEGMAGYYRLGGFLTMDYGEAFEARLDRAEDLVDRLWDVLRPDWAGRPRPQGPTRKNVFFDALSGR